MTSGAEVGRKLRCRNTARQNSFGDLDFRTISPPEATIRGERTDFSGVMTMLFRRLVILLYLVTFPPLAAATDRAPIRQLGKYIEVYKSPSCGCCAGWVEYLSRNGFHVAVVDQHDLSEVKARYGIGRQLQSCHTGIVDGYVVEGHVPADDIWRLLAEKPNASGLTAPGMPLLSPGMNSIEPKGYDVLLFGNDGETSVFSRY